MEQSEIPTPTPVVKRGWADYWLLLLLIAAAVCVWLAIDAFFGPSSNDTATMLGLGQGAISLVAVVLLLLLFVLIGRYSKKKHGYWFTDKTFSN